MCRKLGFFCVSVYIVAHCRVKRIIQNLCHMLPQLAKAPAKVLTEHRNALAKEQGSKRQLTLQNASRHYKRTVWRYAFAMGIPISTYAHEEDGRSVAIEWLRPSDILRFLLNKYPSLLLGGCKPGVKAEAMLASFWKQYRLIDPNHALFDGNPPDLHRTIPLNLHGDGARTQKTPPWSCFAWSCFGYWQLQMQAVPLWWLQLPSHHKTGCKWWKREPFHPTSEPQESHLPLQVSCFCVPQQGDQDARPPWGPVEGNSSWPWWGLHQWDQHRPRLFQSWCFRVQRRHGVPQEATSPEILCQCGSC